MQIIEITESGSNNINNENNHIIVGIDFGTTNSLIAISENQLPKIIKDCDDKELIPSTIIFKNNDFIIGEQNKAISISSIKRLFGKSIKDLLNNKTLFSLVQDLVDLNSEGLRLNFADRSMTIPEIASKIFLYLKQQAERDLNTKITKAVITIPAHFNDAARGEVMLAAKIAGLDVLRLVAEPTAAAYAYGLHNNSNTGCYLVYDLGGGTFDVSILNMQVGILQVIATNGDNMLGGDDIDQLVAEYLCDTYKILDIKQIIPLAKQAKEMLSYHSEFNIKNENNISLNKKAFEQLITPLIKRTIDIVKDTIESAGNPNISGIILVGGTTRINLITKMLKNTFNIPIFSDIDPDKAVAWGAALQAENLTSINSKNSLLIDVVPLTLGIELYGGLQEKIILRNSPIPISVTKEFTTYVDNQNAMQFHIVQGEREMVSSCRSLAKFKLNNLPLMKAGSIRIEVIFSIDANGILSVSALEKNSGKLHNIEVKPSYGLSQEEINKILEEAYKNATIDHSNRLLQEAIVNAKSLIYNIKNAIKETPNLILKNELNKISQTIITLENAITLNNRDLIIKQSENLKSVTENFLSKRLNTTIKSLLKDKYINQIK